MAKVFLRGIQFAQEHGCKIGVLCAFKALLEFSSSHPLWATRRKKEQKEKGDGKQNEKSQESSHKLLKENAWHEAHNATPSPD